MHKALRTPLSALILLAATVAATAATLEIHTHGKPVTLARSKNDKSSGDAFLFKRDDRGGKWEVCTFKSGETKSEVLEENSEYALSFDVATFKRTIQFTMDGKFEFILSATKITSCPDVLAVTKGPAPYTIKNGDMEAGN